MTTHTHTGVKRIKFMTPPHPRGTPFVPPTEFKMQKQVAQLNGRDIHASPEIIDLTKHNRGLRERRRQNRATGKLKTLRDDLVAGKPVPWSERRKVFEGILKKEEKDKKKRQEKIDRGLILNPIPIPNPNPNPNPNLNPNPHLR